MDFFLFLLVNFTLFVRPSELIPELAEVPLYNIFIVMALLAAAPKITPHLKPQQLAREPITVCVLGFWAAIVMSHLSKFDLYYARVHGIDFSKVVVYYFLVISVLDSPDRLRRFLYWITFFTTCNASVAIANFYGYIDLPSLRILEYSELIDPETGQPINFKRMLGTGIFGDPNDLSMIAVMGFVVSVSALGDKQTGGKRFLWIIPAAILLATVGLTKSRGGTLALGTAVAILTYFRFGLWRATIAAALFLPLAGLFTAGRSDGMEGTGDERLTYWSEGIVLMKQSPVFGIGMGQLQEEIRHVAHNSYVQSFVELGLFGGMMFLGAFWISVLSFWKLRALLPTMRNLLPDRNLERMLPILSSVVVGACLSMMSLTRNYQVPTFMLLGLVMVFLLETQRQGLPAVVSCNAWRFVGELPMLSALFLALIKMMIRFRLS